MLGFFRFGRQLMGLISWLTAFYKDPDLVRDMQEFWANFLIAT